MKIQSQLGIVNHLLIQKRALSDNIEKLSKILYKIMTPVLLAIIVDTDKVFIVKGRSFIYE